MHVKAISHNGRRPQIISDCGLPTMLGHGDY